MRFNLSQWERHFPNGVSQADYQRIGRIIRRKGMFVEIELKETEPDARLAEFNRILKRLEK